MVEQSTNNILENVYKFNAKELDTQTGYYYYGARYYDPGASIFLSVDPLAEDFPGWNPYHYVHNNPINLIDPTGMSAEGPGEGDPDKQPQKVKVLNIKVYGVDRSIYYTGKPWVIGTGGFNFYSSSGTRGDLSLLKGNSGEGESIDGDAFFSLASYATAYASGSMYKSMKEGVEFIKNILDLYSKGKDIKDGVEKAMTSNTAKIGGATANTSQKLVDVKTKNFKIIYPHAYTDGFVWGKDTIIQAEEGQGQFINFKAKADSIYKASVLESFKKDFEKKYKYDAKN